MDRFTISLIITKYQNIAINSFSIKHEHAHEVVVKNGGCITSHNKRGEQAFSTIILEKNYRFR